MCSSDLVPLVPYLLLAPDPAELRDVPAVTSPPLRYPTGPAPPPLWTPGMSLGINPTNPALAMPSPREEMRVYRIEYGRPVNYPIRLSVVPNEGPRRFQVVRNADTGTVHSTRNNRVTGLMDSRVIGSGTFVLVPNEVNFSDTRELPPEMQSAIQFLAAQGVLHGFSRLEYRPMASLTRAQAASIFSRLLSIEDVNAASGFSDVTSGDWFYNSVGSVRRAGIMAGHNADIFMPDGFLLKNQLVVMVSRVLRTEMGYLPPVNTVEILDAMYSDWGRLPDWSISDVALATREGLVVHRQDGSFAPNAMLTRAEAAIMLYRLYWMLW